MSYSVVLSRKSKKFLKKVPPQDKKRLVGALVKLEQNPWFAQYKKVKGYPFYRIRVGDYRIIYSVDEDSKTVYVVIIGRRESVYDNL
ncbi:type II toxin-antitoxin system RelE family toxin [Thermococcus thioreducens]|uniref:Addiction module toxin RelE n=1 Tax=Thermococcus thioreducens TaxID=277988 RepID=A0A0Q2M581_9EURY|nr:type II toxin-antitoxin system RelE/ParE family toxin [Thermococcus thioreducens]ASJ12448.1 addiction module toxin RelE [Thermococcus thioreducens]KQH83177.1 addiction module toxin RelE [Thermococcus thioreducens]SEV90642.1 mRNA interferase RelE/StbE [Thermococcus thioreducens]